MRRAAALVVAAAALAACKTVPSGGEPLPVYESGPLVRRGVLHPVEKGQTLWRIARAYAVSVQELAEVNDLPDPARIQVGQALWVPGADRVLAVAPYPAPFDGVVPVAPARVEPVRPPPVRPDPVRPDPVRPDPVRPDPVRPDPVRPDPVRPDPVRPEPVRPEPARPDPARVGPARGDPAKPARTEPARAEEAEETERVVTNKSRFQWPIKGVLSSRFGVRDGTQHDGIDILAPEGTPIVAADAGEVLYAGTQRGYGNIVLLRHLDGLITIYAHNATNGVKAGDRLRRGQALGTVGRTGRASAPHLHFEVRQNRLPRNPLFYLP